jgi:hypothetical protein
MLYTVNLCLDRLLDRWHSVRMGRDRQGAVMGLLNDRAQIV